MYWAWAQAFRPKRGLAQKLHSSLLFYGSTLRERRGPLFFFLLFFQGRGPLFLTKRKVSQTCNGNFHCSVQGLFFLPQVSYCTLFLLEILRGSFDTLCPLLLLYGPTVRVIHVNAIINIYICILQLLLLDKCIRIMWLLIVICVVITGINLYRHIR